MSDDTDDDFGAGWDEVGEEVSSHGGIEDNYTDTGETSTTEKTEKTGKTDNTLKTGPESSERPVRQGRQNVNMMLPPELVKRLNREYKRLNLDYEEVHGEEIEKNRHFYPELVEAGLESVRDRFDLTEPDE